MHTQENAYVSREAIVEYRQFHRLADTGLTADRFSEVAADQRGRRFCIDLIVEFLSKITHDLSRAQYGLDSWQPGQVRNASDTMYRQCASIGAERAAGFALELYENAEAGHPRESRKSFKALRSELIFVWQDLQGRLEALRADLGQYPPKGGPAV